MRRYIAAIVGVALTGAAPAAFADRYIECQGKHGKYRYCSIDTQHRSVTVSRQISKTRCRLGDNWDYDRYGIWVDDGCGAEFRVSGSGHNSYHDDRYAYDDYDDQKKNKHKHDDDDNSAAIAGVAAIAGIALIAAMVSNKGSGASQTSDVAPWSVGTFSGYDEFEHVDVELTILPGGSVRGSSNGNAFTGSLNGSSLQMGRYTFNLTPSGNGFAATDEKYLPHRIVFRRTGSGY